jgi:response regulator RpfG family c-di-GMP phosphodiesterase
LKHVENNSDYNRIPILVTTVLDGDEDEKECLKLGVSDFIVKPYSPLLVKMRVENIIHMTESEDMISELEMDALTG